MKLTSTLSAACLVLAGMTVTGQVLAAKPPVIPPPPDYDVKSYPGSGCRQISGPEFAFGWNCNGGGIGDPNIAVTCPIVRDDVMGDDGTYAFEVDVYQGAGGQAFCTAVSWDGVEPVDFVSDSNSVDIEATLDVDLEESVPGGYYTLECILEPGACIHSYRVYEAQSSYSEMTDYDR